MLCIETMLTDNHKPTGFFEEMYDKHAALMYGCIYRLIPNKDIADKILTDVFIDIYNKRAVNNFTSISMPLLLKQASGAAFTYLKKVNKANAFLLKVSEHINEIKAVNTLK